MSDNWLDNAKKLADDTGAAIQAGADDGGSKLKKVAEDSGKAIEEAVDDGAKKIQQAGDEAAGHLRDVAREAQRTIERAGDVARKIFIDEVKNGGSRWLPDASLGSVNNKKFYTPIDGAALVDAAVVRGDNPIKIEIHEREAIKVFSSLINMAEAKAQEEVFGKYLKGTKIASEIVRRTGVSRPQAFAVEVTTAGAVVISATAAEIFAIAACITAAGGAVGGVVAGSILATGVALFIILIAFAILYALHEGYNIKHVALTWQGDKPALDIEIVKP